MKKRLKATQTFEKIAARDGVSVSEVREEIQKAILLQSISNWFLLYIIICK